MTNKSQMKRRMILRMRTIVSKLEELKDLEREVYPEISLSLMTDKVSQDVWQAIIDLEGDN